MHPGAAVPPRRGVTLKSKYAGIGCDSCIVISDDVPDFTEDPRPLVVANARCNTPIELARGDEKSDAPGPDSS